MSQCLHCSKPCAEQAVFCESCQVSIAKAFHPDVPDEVVISLESPSVASVTDLSNASVTGEPTLATPVSPVASAQTPRADELSEPPALLPETIDHHDNDQTLSKLNAAARWIEEETNGERRALRSRSARLKPLRDISSEIQRASTPHPRLQHHAAFETQPEAGPLSSPALQQAQETSHPQHNAWLHLHAIDEDETERDLWKDTPDPLALRSRPNGAEAARIEQADLQRIELEESPTLLSPIIRRSWRRPSLWRLAFASLALLALLVLAIDGWLLSFAFQTVFHPLASGGGPPTLTLSSSMANTGEQVSVHLSHFTPSTTVALTHDVQETLLTTAGTSAITIGATGQASASFAVSDAWKAGFHLIVAEDVSTRDTASAMLQVSGTEPSRPPHLLLETSSLNLGDSVQGANTIQSLLLRNSGSGSISWSASSDQPWLLVAPDKGTFSTGQTISVAAQRNNLPVGTYNGTIAISSSVGAPEQLHVSMKVSALPPDAGPMISLVPPLLSFDTTDGTTAPLTQTVTLSNPGQQTLYWSFHGGPTITTIMQNTFLTHSSQATDAFAAPDTTWLSIDHTSGALPPGQNIRLHLTVHSQSLLPGAYMETLTFNSAHSIPAYDTPQMMNVALTVEPHCGLLTSAGNLAFTAVAGQSNPSNQTLSLNATSSCSSGTINWQAMPSTGWITVNPASGQVKGMNGGVTSVGVNTALLAPGKYTGLVTFLAGKSTQTVVVQLTLQPPPAPSEPVMGASPFNLNFSTIQGQANPAGQVVTITNNGGSPLRWHASTLQFSPGWASVTPAEGTVLPGQTGQTTVNVATSGLTPGNYTGQIMLSATDTHGSPASGSPQLITVNLVVQPPCTLAQPSQSALLFNAFAGGANPLAQTVALTATGSCAWPLHWTASVSSPAPWLMLSSGNGLITSAAQASDIIVGVNARGLQPGTYTTQVQINAIDAVGAVAQGNPQSFNVTLTVLQPCTLQPLPAQIILSAQQGQTTPVSQTLTLNETGSCADGVAWTALGDAASSSWLTLSPTSGTNDGNSTITVSVTAANLTPGSYTGQITISASNNGVVLQGSPQTITISFQVSGYTVSGSVLSCNGPAPTCTISSGLAGATVSLISGGTTIATTTTDASGNFTFTNIPLGSYTLQASGAASLFSYTGTTTVLVKILLAN